MYHVRDVTQYPFDVTNVDYRIRGRGRGLEVTVEDRDDYKLVGR